MASETVKKRNIKKTEPAEQEVPAEKGKGKKKSYRVKVDLDPHMIIPVRNGFPGRLIYISKKTGEEFWWDGFGDEQDMELSELKSARNSSKAFFENNWFLIDDPEVIEYLNAKKFYEDAFNIEDFQDIFDEDPKEIEERISKLSKGQKNSVKYMSKQLINDGTIDSLKVIEALEKALGVQLIER